MDRCIEGRLYRHQPFPDDPHFERDVGECPGCSDCEPPTRTKMRLVSESNIPTAKHLIELVARGEHTKAQIVEACQLWMRLQQAQADPLEQAVAQERERCADIVHKHQIAFCSDACGWALDKIKDGLPADAIRVAPNADK